LIAFVLNRHSEFEVGGVKHIRLVFYIEGPSNKGTVHVEAKQVATSASDSMCCDISVLV